MVALTIDGSQIKKLVQAVKHIEDGVPKVVKPVIAECLEVGKQAVKKAIQAQYVIQSSDIHMEVVMKNNMSGAVEIRGGMLRLTRFPHHPTAAPRGVMPALMWAQVKRGGGGVMPGGFMTASGDGIFIRSGGASRLPINKLLTIGAPIMASQPSVGPVANKEMGDDLAFRIDKALRGVLAGG
jgi:hypothetical protein